MKKIGLVLVMCGAALAVAPANAADLSAAPLVKAPMIQPFSWTGLYIGGNAGYGWGKQDNSLSIVDGTSCHFGCVPESASLQASYPGPSGFTGGGQIGYNWQASNWVYGIELDFESFRLKQDSTSMVSFPGNTSAGNCGLTLSDPCVGSLSNSVKTNWLLTLRPRVGYAWDRSLIYATGGLAVTRISFAQSYRDNIDFGSGVGGSETASGSKTIAGWTVGAGFEQALDNHWSLKAEYLYARFGGFNVVGHLTDGASPAGTATFNNSLGAFSTNIVRGGVNYRF